MRTAKIVVITLFAVFLVEFIAAEVFLRTHRFSAKEKPSWLESVFAQHARNVSVPADARGLKNPRAVTDETIIAEAREHWTEHCSTCHSIDGRGDTAISRGMYPPAPNLNDPQTQQKTDGELFFIISNGVRFTGMPGWQEEDSAEEIWDLVSFIRHLPQLTPEEFKQMNETGREGKKEPREDKPGVKTHTHSHQH